MAESIILVTLATFGVIYGVAVAHYPDFPFKQTWAKVAVGEAATDAGMSLLLWLATGDWRACLVPWLSHATVGVLAWRLAGRLGLSSRLTWLRVVNTDALADGAASFALMALTGNDWFAMFVPWLCHTAAGVPMIGTQELKYYRDADAAELARKIVEGRK